MALNIRGPYGELISTSANELFSAAQEAAAPTAYDDIQWGRLRRLHAKKRGLFGKVRCDTEEAILKSGAPGWVFQRSLDIALTWACISGKVGAATLLLDGDASPNARCDSQGAALSYAIQGGHLEVVELLVSRGGDVNSTTEYGQSILMYAAEELGYGEHDLDHGPQAESGKQGNPDAKAIYEFLVASKADENYESHYGSVKLARKRGRDTRHKELLDFGPYSNKRK